jgi:hypothetical protein
MKRHLRSWGAVWLLVFLWLASWGAQFFNQLDEITQSAEEHGGQFVWGDFWPQFWAATAENWQSEFLQLAVQAVLVASYVGQKRMFRAEFSADKDDIRQLNEKLDRLLAERQVAPQG